MDNGSRVKPGADFGLFRENRLVHSENAPDSLCTGKEMVKLRMRMALTRCSLLLLALCGALVDTALAQFDPPRIAQILHKRNEAGPSAEQIAPNYYIDKGQEASIFVGSELNVYRERFVVAGQRVPMRIFIGTLKIELAQQGSAVGAFVANKKAMQGPIIKYKSPMKGDVVVPKLILDSGVLFDPGAITLKPGAAQEFNKIANFVRNFTPSKLIIEGHTDGDGSAEANQKLSENRAGLVQDFLIAEYDFITPNMVEGIGYGEERPIVENSTPENKALNRRIEVVIWE